MKLAICTVGELFGGVERHILGMSTWLKREGHDFVLVLFHDRELARQAREIGVEPVILEGRGSFDLGVVKRLGAVLAEHEVDVVHAHGYKAVVNCALARRRHKFAMVRTVHGLVESAGWWTWKGFKGNFYTGLERFFGRREGTAVTYVTDDLRQRNENNDRGLVTKTIHNGIAPLRRADFARPDDLDSGVFNLAAVGRVSRVKGLEFAIRAVSRLDPDLKVVLNIIGTGPMVGELKTLADEVARPGSVRFLGFKNNVYDYLAHIDALIMPSYHEGLPYTILEAMSLRVPIIASRVGGLVEALDDGSQALLVEVGNVSGLEEAVSRLARDEEIRKEFGEAAGRKQASRFNLDSLGSQYWDFFNSALSRQ